LSDEVAANSVDQVSLYIRLIASESQKALASKATTQPQFCGSNLREALKLYFGRPESPDA
jgi:hypothetical protein